MTEQNDTPQKLRSCICWVFFIASSLICWLWIILGIVGQAFGDKNAGIFFAATALGVVMFVWPVSVVFGAAIFRESRSQFRWVFYLFWVVPLICALGFVIYVIIAETLYPSNL